MLNDSRRIVEEVLADLVNISWHIIHETCVRMDETAELEWEEEGNAKAEAAIRAREEERLRLADLDAVRQMQDDAMERIRKQERNDPDIGDSKTAQLWADGPAARGWVLEQMSDAIISNDTGTILRLLAELSSSDRNTRVSCTSQST